MKLTKLGYVLLLGFMFAGVASGCRKRPGYVTNIPPGKTPEIGDVTNTAPLTPAPPVDATSGGFAQTDPSIREKWVRNREVFKEYTVHFEYDSSSVKSAEKPKLAAVADYLKNHTQDALEIEGHCDERGTEEYNRSLGERRALALREQLIALGIDPSKIDTKTLGKDRPVDSGHNEAAWKQNRRGEFLLEEAPK
jgi:peptidoglycan-associated lipoprotein